MHQAKRSSRSNTNNASLQLNSDDVESKRTTKRRNRNSGKQLAENESRSEQKWD
jgi:hypothetical protein